MPLLERVLRGNDEELANRVRAVLRMPQNLRKRAEESPRAAFVDAKEMAERSIRAGYMKDALKYLEMAHEADPADFNVMLKMGWTLQHPAAGRHGRAVVQSGAEESGPADRGRSGDGPTATCGPALARVRTSGWMFPMYSTRWRDFFSYGQVRTEVRVPGAGAAVCERAVHRRYAADAGEFAAAVPFGKLRDSGAWGWHQRPGTA